MRCGILPSSVFQSGKLFFAAHEYEYAHIHVYVSIVIGEHRLIRPYHPQTNGMVERFNRRIGEAMAEEKRIRAIHRSHNQAQKYFNTHEDRNQFIHTFVANYNKTRLACINYKSPAEMMRNQAGAYIIRGKCTVSGFAAVFNDWIPEHAEMELLFLLE